MRPSARVTSSCDSSMSSIGAGLIRATRPRYPRRLVPARRVRPLRVSVAEKDPPTSHPQETAMPHVTVIGTGNMGQAIAGVLTKGGATVDLVGHADTDADVSGDIVVLAVPYLRSTTSWPSARIASRARSSSTSPTR